ncbi:hypothetical protein H4R18_002538 [Coemansia javaensis]|uniref:Thioesterase domain-containing protein n=1 Tax=Coemansia javaensis TaxID=2761396 RepID=A0A9W8HBT0_9FUNG|nr:hypothetical protein H4R18_002538 [Coemansia javaensis]
MLKSRAAAGAAVLARRLLAPLIAKSAADIIRERASLAAVAELAARAECSRVDVAAALRRVTSIDSHIGCDAISTVPPLVFGWRGAGAACMAQLALDKVPPEQRPSAQFAVPMVTLIEHVDGNASGHPGLIHGGMTAVMAQTAASLAAALNAAPGAAVGPRALNMDYRKPIRTGSFVKIHAWPYELRPGGLRAAVHIYGLGGEVLVEATADLAV